MSEDKNISLLVLGMIGIIAVIGLVLMFSGNKHSTGALFTNTGVTADAPCDSPCTLFPSGNDYDAQMMENRLSQMNWKFSHYVTFTYITDGRKEVLGCWCPTQGTPQFIENENKEMRRALGTPVDQYSEKEYPAAKKEYATGTPEEMPEYPLGTNTY
ncbi:hypothetical protein B6U93_00705 [Candidatus Woesearchaeota archaeon ex4484_78]|nr:MAG: hypothetical protein B6U93_00705 [Candidatus Woesearchaeota archaeon ex4484_78]